MSKHNLPRPKRHPLPQKRRYHPSAPHQKVLRAPHSTHYRRNRRSRIGWPAVIGIGLILVVATGWLIFRGSSNRADGPVVIQPVMPVITLDVSATAVAAITVGGGFTAPTADSEPDMRGYPHPAPRMIGCCHQCL